MTLIYSTTCNACDTQTAGRPVCCPACESEDLYCEVVASVYEYDDVADARRLDEIRAEHERVWDEMDAAADRQPYEPSYSQEGFLRRRQGGGL